MTCTLRVQPQPGNSPGLLSVGGDRRSRIWASLSPSTHWTSRVRSSGQLELQRAETAIHEQPDSTKSRSPRDDKRLGVRGHHPSHHHCTFGVHYQDLTRQPVDEPTQLLLGDIGPAEVKGDRLSPDDATQHQGCDGLAVVQVDAGPQPLIAAPGSQARWESSSELSTQGTPACLQ